MQREHHNLIFRYLAQKGLPDNDDFYQERNNRLGMGHRDLLEHLRDKDRQYYYDQVLVPMPDTTLKDFI